MRGIPPPLNVFQKSKDSNWLTWRLGDGSLLPIGEREFSVGTLFKDCAISLWKLNSAVSSINLFSGLVWWWEVRFFPEIDEKIPKALTWNITKRTELWWSHQKASQGHQQYVDCRFDKKTKSKWLLTLGLTRGILMKLTRHLESSHLSCISFCCSYIR